MKYKIFNLLTIIITLILLTSCLSNEKTILIDFNNDTEIVKYKIKDHSDITNITVPKYDGYVFLGFYLDSQFNEVYDESISIKTINILYAKWEAIKYYNISFDINCSTQDSPNIQKVEEGKKAKKPDKPFKEGYIFLGWYLNNEIFDFESTITENIHLTAFWEEEIIEPEFVKISFDLNFNSEFVIKSILVEQGSKVEMPTVPNRQGYNFVGWYLVNEEFNFNEVINNDINLIAKWEKLDLTFLEVFNYTMDNHLNSNKFNVSIEGTAVTTALGKQITQNIYSIKEINNDYLYLFNASHGLASTYVLLESNGDMYNLKKGKTNEKFEQTTVDYDSKVYLEDYIDEFGINPYELNYIINNNTIEKIIDSEETNDYYIYNLKLTDSAAINYKKYIMGVNNMPSKNVKFSNIEVKFIITKDFKFKEIYFNETYDIEVKIIFGAYTKQSIVNTIKEEYSYDD